MDFQEMLELLESSASVEELNERREEIAGVIPTVRIMFGFDQVHVTHQYDLWIHTLHVVTGLPRGIDDDMLYLAALLHDIGKPDTQIRGKDPEDPNLHYFGHPHHGRVITEERILPELERRGVTLSRKDRKRLLYYIEYHDDHVEANGKSLKKIFRESENYEAFHNLMVLQVSDAIAHVQIPIVVNRVNVCTELAGETGRRLYDRFLEEKL